MINLKSLTSSLKQTSKKLIGSNDFMDVMSNEIKLKKQESQNSDEQLEAEYQFFLLTGMSFLKIFTKNLSKESFDMAADNFVKAIDLKSNRAESYFYLAWLFNIAQENETAVKYLKVARSLKPDMEGLNQLSEEITKSINTANHQLQKSRNLLKNNK